MKRTNPKYCVSFPLRVVSGLMVVVEVLVGFAPQLHALEQSSSEPVAPFRRISVETPAQPKTIEIPASGHFSNPPKDEEITRTLAFAHILVPIGTTTPEQNRELASLLMQLRQSPTNDAVVLVNEYLSRFPNSAWRFSLQSELGSIYRTTGYFTKALENWEMAWELGKKATDFRAIAIADSVIGEMLQLNSRLGRYEKVEALLDSIRGRNLHGPATEKVQSAREGLYTMKHFPERAFLCGPYALERIRTFQDAAHANDRQILSAKSTLQGCSLDYVHRVSEDAKMGFQIAKRTPGSEVITPAVIHWKAGHYAALIKKIGDKYLVQDPTFGSDMRITQAALDSEASGYCLVRKGLLPKGWLPVRQDEAGQVLGKGTCNDGDQSGTGKRDIVCTCEKCCKKGMPSYSFHALLASLHIEDTPVGYSPPRGPVANFTVSYNSRETNQPVGDLPYGNLGYKWTFDWFSYIIDGSSSGGGFAVALPGGGTAQHVVVGGGAPSNDWKSKAGITGTPGNYVRELTDGSKQYYTLSDGNPTFPKYFMTKFVDAQGNTNSYEYDGSFRLIHMIDAIGQTNTVYYERIEAPLLITRVVDPFGRFATFDYTFTNSTWRLTQITDAIGMSSQFTYGDNDFISSMTTPYGTTTFARTETGDTRSLEAVNPIGQKERLEYLRDKPVVTAPILPAGMMVSNDNTEFRNSFYWDHEAMQEGAGDYSKAKVFHWLHLAGASGVASGVLESEKMPLEGRVWYNYQGQTIYHTTGTNDQPTIIGRVLDDGTTQLTRLDYNGKNKVTMTVDPLGRTNRFIYSANQIDLKEIQHLIGTNTELLGAISYNDQHLPMRITNAAGSVTSLGYDAQGQLTSVTNAKLETVTFSYSNSFLINIVGSLPNSSISLAYDGLNRVRTVTDSQGYSITNSYDRLDRLTKVEYPDGTSEVVIYDKLDAIMTKDRRNQWASTIYNAARQPIVSTDAMGRLTHFDWCNCGALGSITDPLGRITTWVRDIQGRVTSKIYPDMTYVNYEYENSISRLKSVTDAKNQRTLYRYNIDNTLMSVMYTNALVATPGVSFTYDTNYARVQTMTDGTGTTVYSYNSVTNSLGAGMLYSIDGPLANDTVTYRYDELDRVTNQAINNVGVNVTYDSLGRVQVMTNALGSFTNAYDSNTLALTTVAYPNGQTVNLGYYGNDRDQRLQTIWNKKSDGTTISKFDYAYDNEGQIQTWRQELGGVSTNVYNFTYDPADQLLHGALSNAVTGVLIKQFFYQYDVAGNRTGEQIDMASTSASFNILNQMTSRTNRGAIQFKGSLNEAGTVRVAGTDAIMLSSNRFVGYANTTNGSNSVVISATDYSNNTTNKIYKIVFTNNAVSKTLSYDLNGNLTNEVTATQTNTYEWDAADRMVARNSGTNRTEFTYDGMSRCVRIVERTNGIVASDKRFVWTGVKQSEERDSSGAIVTKRFFAQGEQIAGNNYYFTRDHLGSVREMTDSSGNIQARYDYDPYGVQTKLSGTMDADFGFTGHYFHQPSGLYLTLFRAYDPTSGRWLSRDPIAELGGLNLYSYVLNNPINLIDPLGLSFSSFLGGIGGAVVGAVIAIAVVTAVAFVAPPVITAMVVFGALAVGVSMAVGSALSLASGYDRNGRQLSKDEKDAVKGQLTADVMFLGMGMAECPDLGPKPKLFRIHPESTYIADAEAAQSLEYWRTRPTQEIVDSLAPGNSESLKTTPDGRMLNGNTRTKVLEERGVDINSLPREVRKLDEMTLDETWTTIH